MPSSRKQRAKKKRSSQSDGISDMTNMDVMLGDYSRNELDSNLEDRKDRPRQDVIQNSKDFRSLPNTNSRENSEITVESARLINSEVTNHVSRKFKELKRVPNTQILDSKNSYKRGTSCNSKYHLQSNDWVLDRLGPQV